MMKKNRACDGGGLRTHYSPIRRNNSTLTRFHSYINRIPNISKKCPNNNKTNTIIDKPILNNQKKNQTIVYESINCQYLKHPLEKISYNYKYDINLEASEKDKLNKSFSRINPNYMQDKLKLLEQQTINDKVQHITNLQRFAIKSLSLQKIKNPSQKEILQKRNELSYNPLLSYVDKHPLQTKTLNNYYYNEKLIRRNNINLYNKPRKAIEDYFHKCQYQFPELLTMNNITHTKPNYIFPEKEKKRFELEIKDEICKNYEKMKNKKRKKYIEDKINKKILNKIDSEYANILQKQKESEKNKQKDMIIDNDILNSYNKYVKSHLHDGEREFLKSIREKMDEEDKNRKNLEKVEKMKVLENFKEWNDMSKKIDEKKKIERLKEKRIWRNYSENFEIQYNKYKKLNNNNNNTDCRIKRIQYIRGKIQNNIN